MDKEALQLEYNNIKQEIFTLMQGCDNLIAAMYTVSIALLGLAYELNNRYIFLLILIFIIPVQGLINVRRYHMARCSIYIKRRLEPHEKDLKWEKTVGEIDSKFRASYLKENRLLKFTVSVVGIGTVIIALIAVVSYISTCVKVTSDYVCCSWIDMIGIALSLILFIAICVLTKDYLDYGKICNIYDKIFDELDKDQKN